MSIIQVRSAAVPSRCMGDNNARAISNPICQSGLLRLGTAALRMNSYLK